MLDLKNIYWHNYIPPSTGISSGGRSNGLKRGLLSVKATADATGGGARAGTNASSDAVPTSSAPAGLKKYSIWKF